jgi:parallel beta-helix repeat protein
MRRLLRTIIVMLVIGLFTLSLRTGISEPLGDRNTIHVNDDNAAGPWTGTEQYPYRHIQDAIDNASATDIISVANGTYYEHLIIPSHLTDLTINYWSHSPGELDDFGPKLIGNGTGTGISIFASSVKITQLEITDYGQEGRDAGIYVEIGVTGVEISANIISESYHGIWIKSDVPDETFHIIEYNVIKNISQRGMSIVLCDRNTIRGNSVLNCTWGVYLHDCYKNTISNNFFSNNTEGLVIDIGIENSVEENTFTDNFYGFGTIGTRSSTIKNNNFLSNTKSDAYFITFNVWNADVWSGNYWGRLVFPLMKPIGGVFVIAKIDLPWLKFDFFPSLTQN